LQRSGVCDCGEGLVQRPARPRVKGAPASVVETRRVVRSSKRTPSLSSSRRTVSLAVDFVMESSRAARVKLPVSTTRTKVGMSSSGLSICSNFPNRMFDCSRLPNKIRLR
jgi:hypothetical protein